MKHHDYMVAHASEPALASLALASLSLAGVAQCCHRRRLRLRRVSAPAPSRGATAGRAGASRSPCRAGATSGAAARRCAAGSGQ